MKLERYVEKGPPALTVKALLSSGVQPLGSKAQIDLLSWEPRVSTSSISSLGGPRESERDENPLLRPNFAGDCHLPPSYLTFTPMSWHFQGSPLLQ